MFIKNCAKIRGKLAGNWRHLQNKGEDGGGGGVEHDEGRDWSSGLASAHLLVGGVRAFRNDVLRK